ncbi:MAG TPA: aminotransferase class V-fold PLP-dependent enzyme [bacterium]|nr:aminotransferase class V-fold PLP-dependent enzyme [bacterium]
MKRDAWVNLLCEAVTQLESWEAQWPEHQCETVSDEMIAAMHELADRLRDNYPFFHPRYAGQMLKPPHPAAWAAYALTMLINPNNHALDGGPGTAKLETEAVAQLAVMLGFPTAPAGYLGHLTSSGTIANLEALWIARESHPGKKIAFGANAHYTHERMCRVLGVEGVTLPIDERGRLSVDALARRLAAGDIGTVVVTLGTTGLGAIDPLDKIIPIARRYGARVHVDAAYGGFFALLAQRTPPAIDAAPFRVIAQADSVVLDPHKHGLQPYGCGCVIFADPAVGRFYRHESPYTYFTSGDLHLGEISLECSRAGAAAAALWTTLRAVPLLPHAGLGEMLAAGRRATVAWAEAIEQSEVLHLVCEPETDILCFAPFPPGGTVTTSQISGWSERLFARAMEPGEHNVYLAKYKMERAMLAVRWPQVQWDEQYVTVLRSVVMKPEHEPWWPRLHRAVTALAEEILVEGGNNNEMA